MDDVKPGRVNSHLRSTIVCGLLPQSTCMCSAERDFQNHVNIGTPGCPYYTGDVNFYDNGCWNRDAGSQISCRYFQSILITLMLMLALVSLMEIHARQHIWTLASGHSQVTTTTHDCRCNNGNEAVLVPPWVGEDYFCDSGNPNSSPTGILYLSDPLWNGAGCGSSTTCCEFNNPPWFCKQLP